MAWSAGARLIDYQCDNNGDRLQGALYLPANYEPGKRYPTATYIYEKLSQNFHAYAQPNSTRYANPSGDGAVDCNQGITYYNTLRELGKDVVLLEYVGENHGLARPINQKDYARRMQEWFDHFLQGALAPDWMEVGVPRLKMEEHLRNRKPLLDPTAKAPVKKVAM